LIREKRKKKKASSQNSEGAEKHDEEKSSFRKSFDNKPVILSIVAPKTFLIPISLMRCSATKVARPKIPKQEIKMAKMEMF
jgi:hypothetical protein